MMRISLLLLLVTANAFVTPTPQRAAVSSSSLNGVLDGEFKAISDTFSNIFAPPAPKEKVQKLPDVVIDPSFKLGGIFLTLGVALDFIPYIQLTLGPLVTLLGLLFLVQTTRVRFCFDGDAFELRMGDKLEDIGENVIVGGENRWDYDSFVNWDFFPAGWIDQPQGPILAYFKETQTPSDKWDEGPGQSANGPEALAKGAVPGQVHFFPILCDAKQLRAEFQKRNCAKL